MKRSLLFIFSLLTVALAAVAQPRISSNKETHNFGQIRAGTSADNPERTASSSAPAGLI